MCLLSNKIEKKTNHSTPRKRARGDPKKKEEEDTSNYVYPFALRSQISDKIIK